MLRFALIVVLILSEFASAQSLCPRIFSEGAPLAELATNEVIKLARQHFDIREFKQTSAEGTRHLILLGEFHEGNSTKAMAVAEELLRRFPIRAIEKSRQTYFEESMEMGKGHITDEDVGFRPDALDDLERLESPLDLAEFLNVAPRPDNPNSFILAWNLPIDSALDHDPYAISALKKVRARRRLNSIAKDLAEKLMSSNGALSITPNLPLWFGNMATSDGLLIALKIQLGLALRKYEDKPWFRKIFPFFYGYATQRDRYMAEELSMMALDETVLVIVGGGHCDGIEKRLTREHGFQLIKAE